MRYITFHARRFRDRGTIILTARSFINAGQIMSRTPNADGCAVL